MANSDGTITLSVQVDKDTLDSALKGVEKSGKSLSSKFSKIGTTIGKTFIAAAAAAGAAIIAITKQSVSAYADYEQLVGGVDTLFKGAADKVKAYAEDAFYTAGVSANEYMQQVISFSAGLINSCAGDTAKAADIANMAMVDMSDNVNKLGTDAELVKNAYNGIAKQNYTMLDNLALGYKGTKSEMEKLLRDAEAYKKSMGENVKYDINNLGDVYQAIHAIQEKMDITGTTAKEAEQTISGSANMMKASWQNVLAAISGGGDLDRAINNLVYSITKYFENIVPVVQRALAGIGKLIEQVVPMLVQNVASALIQAIPNLLNAVYKMIIGLAKGIWDGIKAIFKGGSGGSSQISAQLNTAAAGAGTMADSIGAATDNQNALTDSVKETNKELKKTLAGFDDLQILSSNTSASSGASSAGTTPTAGSNVGGITVETPDISNVDSAVEMKVDSTSWDNLLKTITEIKNIFLTGFWEGFKNTDFSTVSDSIDGIKNSLVTISTSPEVKTAGQNFANSVTYSLGQVAGSVASIGSTIASNLTQGINSYLASDAPTIQQRIANIFDARGQIARSIGNTWSAFANIFSVFAETNGVQLTASIVGIFSNSALAVVQLATQMGADFINFLTQPIIDNQEALKAALDGILGFFSDLAQGIKSLIDDLWQNILSLYEEHIRPLIKSITDTVSEMVKIFLDKWEQNIQPLLDKIGTEFKALVEEHLKPMFDKIFGFVANVFDSIKPIWDELLGPLITKIWDDFIGVLLDYISNLGERLWEFCENVIATISDLISDIIDTLTGIFDFLNGVFSGDWEQAWKGLKEIFKGVLQGIIDLFEGLVNLVIDGLNFFVSKLDLVVSTVGEIVGQDWDIPNIQHIKLPRLAKGAVIPANREFLAVLGDQKHGTNVEAPAELIKQMAKEAYQEMGLTGGQNQQVIKEEHYNLNQTELMTIIYKLVKGGERLNGTSLVKQGGI